MKFLLTLKLKVSKCPETGFSPNTYKCKGENSIKNKIYVAGPMTGIPYFNFHAFDDARDEYLAYDFEVFNPADHDRELLGKSQDWYPEEKDSVGPWKAWAIDDAPSLREMLGADLNWIAHNATHIFMLPGWENSKGAQAEWALARALGLEIIYG